MTAAERFEDVQVWQKAKELTSLIYRLSSSGTFARDFGLRDQMRRAAVSITSNGPEGFESQTQALFVQSLALAKGPAGELRARHNIALEQGYITNTEFQFLCSMVESCSKQLASFIRYVESQPNARRVGEDGVQYDIQS